MRLRPVSGSRSYARPVDLSGIIFVALAVGWAVILIPMALKRHDDEAMSRPVETFSDSVRVVGGTRRPAPAATAGSTAGSTTTAAAATTTAAAATTSAVAATTPAASPAPAPDATTPTPTVETPQRAHTVTRAAARRAARRRRRVLAVLLLALVGVTVTSYLSYTPWWSTAIPAILIVAFLVVARLTVRAQQVRRAAPVQHEARTSASTVEPSTSQTAAPVEVEPDLGREDTQGLSRDELAEAVAVPMLDDGGLWDPLPVTLPTYVNKARARRTVRTIEITGMTSSGHDAADTELARTADEAAKAEAEASSDTEADERRAAGA